jgi:hypothetical protein
MGEVETSETVRRKVVWFLRQLSLASPDDLDRVLDSVFYKV